MKRFGALFLLLILSVSLVLSSCGGSTSEGKNDMAIGEAVEPSVDKETMGGESELGKLPENAKIIRTVNLNGETKDFDSALETIKSKISENGGYVESSNLSGGKSLYNNRNSARQGNFVIRIPAEKLDIFLDSAKGVLNITSSSESTEDVTLSYYDIKSRLETLQSKKTALEGMLEKAENLSDMLTIQDNLYDVIADIEAYQSKLNLYDSKVSYSTINLTISEVVEYTVIEEDESFGARIKKAFKESWENFGEFCQDLIVFLVSVMPILVFPAVGGIIILIVWAIRRNKKNKKDKKIK